MKCSLLLLLLLSPPPPPPHGAANIAKQWTQSAVQLVLHPVLLGEPNNACTNGANEDCKEYGWNNQTKRVYRLHEDYFTTDSAVHTGYHSGNCIQLAQVQSDQ
jgi:hypothetical protein